VLFRSPAWGMQVDIDRPIKRAKAQLLKTRAHGEVPDIEEQLKIINETIDKMTDIVENANTTSTDMLAQAMDGIAAIMDAMQTLKTATTMVAMIPGGKIIAEQVSDLIKTVNATLVKAAKELPPAQEKALAELLVALPKLIEVADKTYSAFMAAQVAALKLLNAATTTELKARGGATDHTHHSLYDGHRHFYGSSSLLEIAGHVLMGRASAGGAHSSHAQLMSMDRAVSRKGCDDCCKAGKAISDAEKKAELFDEGITKLNATIRKALGGFLEMAEERLAEINGTFGKALEDALANTMIPAPALEAVAKVVEKLLMIDLEDMAKQAMDGYSEEIVLSVKALSVGLKLTLEVLNNYYDEKCESPEK